MNVRRLLVRQVSGPAVAFVRKVVGAAVPDVVKVAVLVDIAGTAAALVCTIGKLRRLDPGVVDAYVSDPAGVRAVLGRGRWLSSMLRHVPAAPCGPAAVLTPVVALSAARSPRRASRRAQTPAAESALFSVTVAQGGGGRR